MATDLSEHELAEIYVRYGALLLRRCQRLLGDGQAAEDALQDAFVKIWRHGAAFREAVSPLAWLYRCADRACFNGLAARARRREEALDPQAPGGDGPSCEPAEWHLARAFFHRLDDRMRQIAVLHWIDGMTQEEISTEVGWSRQTVCRKLARLRELADTFAARIREREALA